MAPGRRCQKIRQMVGKLMVLKQTTGPRSPWEADRIPKARGGKNGKFAKGICKSKMRRVAPRQWREEKKVQIFERQEKKSETGRKADINAGRAARGAQKKKTQYGGRGQGEGQNWEGKERWRRKKGVWTRQKKHAAKIKKKSTCEDHRRKRRNPKRGGPKGGKTHAGPARDVPSTGMRGEKKRALGKPGVL